MGAKTLGLSMIVKNEAHVILRVLNSVSSIIDYWVVVDTGSTDGTQELITNFFKEKNIPGELIESEWVDFSTARNISLNAVEPHVDYGMWIDADEEMILEPGFSKSTMLAGDNDSISLRTVYGRVDYTRKNIWKTKNDFSWDGPIHELLGSPNERVATVANLLHVIVRAEGSSWGNIQQKYADHAVILENYTKINSDPRWVFYTAQSYRDCSNNEKAIEWYAKRAKINEGFYEECYISRFMVARLSEASGKSKNECAALYQEAHASDPLRGEAIKSLIQMYHNHKDWENAYVFSLYGIRYNRANPYPNRILFIDKGLYEFEMLELHSLSCFYTNRLEEGSKYYWALRQQLKELGENYFAPEQMQRVLDNEKWFSKPNVFDRPKAIAPPKPAKRGNNFTPPKRKKR